MSGSLPLTIDAARIWYPFAKRMNSALDSSQHDASSCSALVYDAAPSPMMENGPQMAG
jgi:hypothetical protein